MPKLSQQDSITSHFSRFMLLPQCEEITMFFKGSRYANVGEHEITDGQGRVVRYKKVRFIPETRVMFKLPKGVLPVVLLCLGYPATKLLVRRKLGIQTVVHDECYREMSDRTLQEVFQKKYPNVRLEVTRDRLTRIRAVCRRVHGSTFAKKCIQTIKRNGYINMVQRYFGLHYVADLMPTDNEVFIRMIKRAGFTWFEKYKPKKKRK